MSILHNLFYLKFLRNIERILRRKQDLKYIPMEIVTCHYEERENNLYNQILGISEEVEQAEKVKTCIEPLQEQEKRLSQVKQNELDQ